VKQIMATSAREPTKTKERGEIQGARKKIKRQKGTGTARFGDIKNPMFRGGGRVFGPRPRNYGGKVNKKVKDLARKSALTYKVQNKQLMVVEDFNMEAPKTSEFAEHSEKSEAGRQKVAFRHKVKEIKMYICRREICQIRRL
jgi:large subunit ribosomal protein L4